MALNAGTRFGPYEVVEPLGSGGMGEVWRARDTNLKRDVAVKVLPESFVADADRVARFRREAEVLASLNHPNIATIHGLEECDGQTVIVMELVDGPTLADRIAEGPIPPEEALGIARQITNALEAAHGRQIVHRDLKPANIKLKEDGSVKVLDFGISKPIDAAAISGGSPVMTTPAVTQTGVILGTAAYMSPEQARGKLVDQRTDIWAFGCLLFEMLTGQPAFGGEDIMATLARVIDRDTDLSSMPGTISGAVRHTIKLCLEKNPSKRISDIRDVRLALQGTFDPGLETAPPTEIDRPLMRRAMPAAGTAVITALVVGLAAWTLRPEPEVRPTNRFSYSLPAGTEFRSAALSVLDLSDDGRSIVYNTRDGFYLRAMGELEARPVAGTELPAANPFFSPDGRSIAFFDPVNQQIKRIPVSGGAPVVVSDYDDYPTRASWSQDGTIFFTGSAGIMRVPATGGTPTVVISQDTGEQFFGPRLLPDGDSVLFSLLSDQSEDPDTAQIVVQSLSTGKRTELISGGSDARYVPTGHLVYAFGNDLLAVPFDLESLTVTGGRVSLVQGVRRSPQSGEADYAISSDGTLVYVADNAQQGGLQSLVWVDRDGRETPFGLMPRDYSWLRISPQGDRIVARISGDLWVSDVARLVLSPITSTPETEFMPLWTSDGKRVVYSINQGGESTILWTAADGTGQGEPLGTVAARFASVEGWANGGREVVLTYGTAAKPHIGLLDLEAGSDGQRAWRPLIDRAAGASMLSMSPDGKWIAYQSDDSGEYGVYIEQFPDLGDRTAVSTEEGGWAPRWSSDGHELYYRRLGDGAMMVASVETSPSLRVGAPELLFESQSYLPLTTPRAGGAADRNWDVAPDGRFLMIKAATAAGSPEIIVVQNWFGELERLVPME